MYHNAKAILSAGHLELECGQRIRDDGDAGCMDARALREWLVKNCLVDVAEVVCQTWIRATGAHLGS